MAAAKRLVVLGAVALLGGWAGAGIAEAGLALVTGAPCAVGTANCTVVDPDDPSAPGRYNNPNDPVSTSTTNGDTGIVTTSPPTPPSAPAPAPPAD